VALATWSITDPSFNRALEGPVRNWLGRPGAIISDELLMQLGLGVLAVVAVPVIWSGAAAVSLLPPPDGWPLSAGLGGNIGEILSTALTGLLEFAMKPLAARILAGILLGGLAFHALLRAVDIAADDIIAAAAILGERNQDRVAAGLLECAARAECRSGGGCRRAPESAQGRPGGHDAGCGSGHRGRSGPAPRGALCGSSR